MNKNRLEAFSDGVFAIVITLLVLDIRIPKVDYAHLWDAIIAIMPKIISYVYSFFIIGIYWVSHHNITRWITAIDRTIIWLNITLLLFVGFIPFPTSLMGEYPFQKIPIVLYGLTLLASNLTGYLTWRYVSKNNRFLDPNIPEKEIRGINMSFLFVNLFYVIAIGVSFVNPYLSYIMFLSVVAYLVIFRSKEHKQHKSKIT